MELSFYNVDIVKRQHPHFLRSSYASNRYVTLESTSVGDVKIELLGKKTGTARTEEYFHRFEYVTHPSHLVVTATLRRTMLTDPVASYPCKMRQYGTDDGFEVFHFYDKVAFLNVFQRLSSRCTNVESMIVEFFADWERLDANREKRSANSIRRMYLERIYAPDRSFFRTQARYGWDADQTEDAD